MKFHRLGRSELLVSELCLGTMTFGQQNTAREAEEQLDLALERGINFIDAAEMYPVPARAETQGRTEAIVGDWLSRKDPRSSNRGDEDRWSRPAHHVATRRRAGGESPKRACCRRGEPQTTEDRLHRPLSNSLARRYVPMFGDTQYRPEEERSATPISEQLAAFAEMIREGKIRYIGLSNETPWGRH